MAKGKTKARPVRGVRRSGRGRLAVPQTPPAGQAAQAQGDPFAAVEARQTGEAPDSRIKVHYVAYCLDGTTYYYHRDLKHPVVVRRID